MTWDFGKLLIKDQVQDSVRDMPNALLGQVWKADKTVSITNPHDHRSGVEMTLSGDEQCTTWSANSEDTHPHSK